jgi:hypothetical protein
MLSIPINTRPELQQIWYTTEKEVGPWKLAEEKSAKPSNTHFLKSVVLSNLAWENIAALAKLA